MVKGHNYVYLVILMISRYVLVNLVDYIYYENCNTNFDLRKFYLCIILMKLEELECWYFFPTSQPFIAKKMLIRSSLKYK